jgi:hypothetical protein
MAAGRAGPIGHIETVVHERVCRTTKWVGLGVRLLTRIWGALGSNLGKGTSYIEVYRGCPRSLQAKHGIVPRLGQDRFLPNPFRFIYEPTIRYSY